MKKVLAIFLMVLLLTGAAMAAEMPAAEAESTCAHENVEMVIAQAATCTEPGYAKFVCADCGTVTGYSYIPAEGHDYVAVVTEPTCTTDGFTTYTCAVCGDSYTADVVPALGHVYEAYVTEPTCTEGGFTTYYCAACGDSYVADETEALGHVYTYQYDAAVVLAEDGTIAGYDSYGTWACEGCGDVVEASLGNAIYYIGEVGAVPAVEPAPAEEAAAEEGSEEAAAEEAPYEPIEDTSNWGTICWISLVVIVVIGAALMLSFGKKPEEN